MRRRRSLHRPLRYHRRRYEKLMLRRIDWNARREEEEEEEEDPTKPNKPPNYCHLVWQVRGQRQGGRLEPAARLAAGSFRARGIAAGALAAGAQPPRQPGPAAASWGLPTRAVHAAPRRAGRGQGALLPQVQVRYFPNRGRRPHLPVRPQSGPLLGAVRGVPPRVAAERRRLRLRQPARASASQPASASQHPPPGKMRGPSAGTAWKAKGETGGVQVWRGRGLEVALHVHVTASLMRCFTMLLQVLQQSQADVNSRGAGTEEHICNRA